MPSSHSSQSSTGALDSTPLLLLSSGVSLFNVLGGQPGTQFLGAPFCTLAARHFPNPRVPSVFAALPRCNQTPANDTIDRVPGAWYG